MNFSTQYPYLTYWIENHGYIQFGMDDDSYSDAFLLVLDAGGTCWEDADSSSVDDALQKAEEYLRTKEIPERFGNKIIKEIEASSKKKEKG